MIALLGAVFTTIFLIWARRNITAPILLLEEGVVAFANRSHGQRDVNLLQYEEPDIHTENEVELLSHAVTKMTVDMQDYVQGILSAEKKANQMEGLAIKDTLTGVRNILDSQKIYSSCSYYDREMEMVFGVMRI